MYETLERMKLKGTLTKNMIKNALKLKWITNEEADKLLDVD